MNSSSTILGIDLGGTKTAIALFDAVTMEQKNFTVFPTDAKRGFPAVQKTILDAIKEMRQKDTIAIGLGVPGFIDHEKEVIVTMPNIPGAEGMEFAAYIQYETGLPTVVENDARCFTFAESLLGAGKQHDIVLGITLGTGVGGGIVINQKLFRGSRGYAGEVGHLLLQPGKPPYPTDDQRGEAEQFLSGTAMGYRCQAAKRPEDYLEGEVCGFLQPNIFKELCWLIVDVMHVLDPSIIILGGSAGRAMKPHVDKIQAELKHWLLPTITPPDIVVGTLSDAAVRGAALLARPA